MSLPKIAIDLETADQLPSLPLFAYTKLREEILSGRIPVGTVLRQQKVAERLGISRLPIREALTRLEAEGIVVFKARHGYSVASLSPAEISEIFDIRMVVEEHAGYLAAQTRTLDDIRRVEAALATMESLKVSSPEDAQNFAVCNRNFHETLFAASGRRHLSAILINLRDKVEPMVRVGALMEGHLKHVQKDHREIFEAFKRGDAEKTAFLCSKHVREAVDRFLVDSRAEYDAPRKGVKRANQES